jgi:uncharacterized protein YebE (UPF0316 family)
MSTTVFVTFSLIVLARITDVTLDTIRTVAIVQGRRTFAALLGFCQAIVYICAIAKVLMNMDHPVYALAYGLGFAIGTYLGIAIEQRLAFGQQVVSIVTTKGVELGKVLRAAGYRFAEVKGHVRDGDLTILYVEIPRRLAPKLIREARTVDDACSCIVNDVRMAEIAARRSVMVGKKLSNGRVA